MEQNYLLEALECRLEYEDLVPQLNTLPPSSLRETLVQALSELAELTPLEIAQKLAADGQLNVSRSRDTRSTTCPIAQFLLARSGSEQIIVSASHATYIPANPVEDNGVRLPQSVRDFVTYFDKGRYDHLRTWRGEVDEGADGYWAGWPRKFIRDQWGLQ